MTQEQTKRLLELALDENQGVTLYTYRDPWVKVETKPDSLPTPLWAWFAIAFVAGMIFCLVTIHAWGWI